MSDETTAAVRKAGDWTPPPAATRRPGSMDAAKIPSVVGGKAEAQPGDSKPTKTEVVLEGVLSGITKPAELAKLAGISRSAARATLVRLGRQGKVVLINESWYPAGATPKQSGAPEKKPDEEVKTVTRATNSKPSLIEQVRASINKTAAAAAAVRSINDIDDKIETLTILANQYESPVNEILLSIVRDYDLIAGRTNP